MDWESVLSDSLEKLYGNIDVKPFIKLAESHQSSGIRKAEGPVLITYPDSIRDFQLKDWNYLVDELGFIKAVHFLPTLFEYSNDRGFSIIDHWHVRPELGRWEDFKKPMMIDLVLNHVSAWHPWFIRARLGMGNRDYFISFSKQEYEKLEEEGAFSRVVRPRDTPLFTEFEFARPFSWKKLEDFASSYENPDFISRYGEPGKFVESAKAEPEKFWFLEKDVRFRKMDGNINGLLWLLREMGLTEKRMVWTTFSTPYAIDQVDLNYRNPEVLREMAELALFYAEKGASMIRLDAITFAWKELFGTCVHGKSHEIVRAIKAILRLAGFETLIITETNVPMHENVEYLKPDEADVIYNFTLQGLLLYAAIRDPAPMVEWLGSSPKQTLNFISVHDGISMRGLEGLEREEEIRNFLLDIVKENGMIKYRLHNGKKVPYELCFLPSQLLSRQKLLMLHAFLMALKGIPAFYYATLFGCRNGKFEMEERDLVRPVIKKPDVSWLHPLEEWEETARKLREADQEYLLEGKVVGIKSPDGTAWFNFGKAVEFHGRELSEGEWMFEAIS